MSVVSDGTTRLEITQEELIEVDKWCAEKKKTRQDWVASQAKADAKPEPKTKKKKN